MPLVAGFSLKTFHSTAIAGYAEGEVFVFSASLDSRDCTCTGFEAMMPLALNSENRQNS
jgi:hypothetical protein